MALGSKYPWHVFHAHYHLKFNPNEAMVKNTAPKQAQRDCKPSAVPRTEHSALQGASSSHQFSLLLRI